MKFKLIAAVVLALILAIVYFVVNDNETAPKSHDDSGLVIQ